MVNIDILINTGEILLRSLEMNQGIYPMAFRDNIEDDNSMLESKR